MILVHAPVGSFSSEACSVEGCQYRAHINNNNRKERKKKKKTGANIHSVFTSAEQRRRIPYCAGEISLKLNLCWNLGIR